jgi:hypothetical protein
MSHLRLVIQVAFQLDFARLIDAERLFRPIMTFHYEANALLLGCCVVCCCREMPARQTCHFEEKKRLGKKSLSV